MATATRKKPARKKAATKRAPKKKPARKKPVHAKATGQTRRIQAKMKAVLTSLSKGASVTAAVQAAGMGRATYYDLLGTRPDFAAKVEAAQAKAIQSVEHAMFRRARSMTYNGAVTAGIFLLKNKLPDEYQDVQNVSVVDRVAALNQLVEGGEHGVEAEADTQSADR